jgi:hypothetical protein
MRHGSDTPTPAAVLAAALWLTALAVGCLAIANNSSTTARMPFVLADIWLVVGASACTMYVALSAHADRGRRSAFEHGYLAAYTDLVHATNRRDAYIHTQTKPDAEDRKDRE